MHAHARNGFRLAENVNKPVANLNDFVRATRRVGKVFIIATTCYAFSRSQRD